jgi:hypothetical protein
MNQFTGMPTLVEIAAGSLDDPGQFKPMASIFAASAPAWAPFPSDLPKYPKMPG